MRERERYIQQEGIELFVKVLVERNVLHLYPFVDSPSPEFLNLIQLFAPLKYKNIIVIVHSA